MSVDWHDVAASKVLKILGEREGLLVMNQSLDALGIRRIETLEQMRLFASLLEKRGDFCSAVAAVLNVQIALRAG